MPTKGQLSLYMSLRCSSEFTQDEIDRLDLTVIGHNAKGEKSVFPPFLEQVQDTINFMLSALTIKDKRQADALKRKAEYREWAQAQRE